MPSYENERMTACVARTAEPIRDAAKLIRAKVADATAHARSALTMTLKDVPDGRKTIAKLRQSRSFDAAVARLDEASASLISIISDAREEFYRDSWDFSAKTLPESVRRTGNPEPPEVNVNRARAVVLFGITLTDSVRLPVSDAGRRLRQTLAASASRAVRDKDASDQLTAWETRTVNGLISVASRLIGDSSVRLEYIAGRDVIKPELLEDDPTL